MILQYMDDAEGIDWPSATELMSLMIFLAV